MMQPKTTRSQRSRKWFTSAARLLAGVAAIGLMATADNVAAQNNKGVQGRATQALPGAQAQNMDVATRHYQDWIYRCVRPKNKAAAKYHCEVVQVAQAQRGGQRVNLMTMSISSMPQKQEEKTVMTILTPLNVLLPVGFGLSVDEANPVKMTYRNCNRAGCWIQTMAPTDLMTSMKDGTVGVAHMRLINGRNVNVKFSLKGLTAALKALESGKPPKKDS